MQLIPPIFKAAIRFQLQLWLRKGRPAVVFDLASAGEFQFFRNVLCRFVAKRPDVLVILVHPDTMAKSDAETLIQADGKILLVANSVLRQAKFSGLGLFATSEQYSFGLKGVYSCVLFHGQPSKGLTFTDQVLRTFDALFLYGPMHRSAFEEYCEIFGRFAGEHLDLFNVGYPKSDDLLNGVYSKDDVVARLGLDPSKKTVLYAPAFNEGASLREFGPELIEILARQRHYNVLVKLPIDCWEPTSSFYATGGIDWFAVIEKLQGTYENLRLFKEYQIDPLLACADVLVTCISSVSFEFMALGKPVVFVETPKYYSGYLKRVFPEMNTIAWARRTTVNGGKEFGLVVDRVADLPEAIQTVLENPAEYPKQRNRLQSFLLYNRGRAAEAAVATMEDLLARKVKTKRPCHHHGILWMIVQTAAQRTVGGVRRRFQRFAQRIVQRRGYTLVKSGQGFISAQEVVAAARSRGLSVCEYRESLEDNPQKMGRRDRIIQHMEAAGVFQNVATVLEIGAGTGMYLEKILLAASPSRYEVYETDRGWVKFLQAEYCSNVTCRLVCHSCDGRSLAETGDGSIDLVHAHAVFVYLPLIQIAQYLKEVIRVCKPGGYIVFDCFKESSFASLNKVESWLSGPHHFPVVIPSALLEDIACTHALTIVEEFEEVYGSGNCNYIIWRKHTQNSGEAKKCVP